jgi:uncharacterized protein (TIGR04255 family)
MAEPDIKYPNPPIQEVICELHFAVKEPLSLSTIEECKGLWSNEYPDQNVTEEKNIQFQVDPKGTHFEEMKVGHRLICKSSDGSRLVQLSGRFLAVNQLKPYPGWEEGFRDTILARAKDLVSTIGPMPLSRAGLRYINRIEVPDRPLIWENWFNFSLPVPKIGDSQLEGFQMHFERSLPESCRLLVNCLSAQQASQIGTTVILDLDVVWQGEPVEHGDLPVILERVHAPHRLVFESYLTDKLRKTFS